MKYSMKNKNSGSKLDNGGPPAMDYVGIDRFRIAAAVMVIAIHTSPLLSFSKAGDMVLTGILARVAVPFFFMATGFFLFQGGGANSFSYMKFLRKNMLLYGAAILLFLPLSIYAGHFNQSPFLPELLKDIVFNGTFYHLWYFPAVMLGVGVVVILQRYLRFQTAFTISFVLYLVGLLGDSYYGFSSQAPFIREVYHILFQCFDYTRNGLFFTPVYLMLGIFLSKRKPLPLSQCIPGLSVSLSLLLAEGLLLHYFSAPRHDSMYLMLPVTMYFLFQLLLLPKGQAVKTRRTVSLLIYLIHPWCIVLVRGFAKVIKAQEAIVHNSIIFFLAVTALSVFLAAAAGYLWERRKAGKTCRKGRAWAEISRSRLRHNLTQLESALPENCRAMAVVKADAYGHGAVAVAAELQATGVKAFAVASLEEGIQLRKNGIRGTILIMGCTHPQNAVHLIRYRLVQTVVDHDYAIALNRELASGFKHRKAEVHIKIDTGMHRLGEGCDHLKQISDMFQLPNLKISGMYTHLCAADSRLEEDVRFTGRQIECFYQVAEYLKGLGAHLPALHLQSSYGILNYPELRCDFARIGIALYGAMSQEDDRTKVSVDLKPVMSIRARISVIKKLSENETVGYGRQFKADRQMRIATVSIGYADGIPRNLSGGRVLINGMAAPIIGRICMDQLTVDITHIPGVGPGDIATIMGQDGKEKITPEQLARGAGTITNELFSRLGSRLERIYL